MKFSNLSFFNSRGEELKTNIFFDISWRIEEPLLDDAYKSCKIYPTGYIDGDNNVIISNPGVIYDSYQLWENGYLIFNPRINNDNWEASITERFSSIKLTKNKEKRQNALNENPFIVSIKSLYNSQEDFEKNILKLNFSTSEISDDLDDTLYSKPEYKVLNKFENINKKSADLEKFWTFINNWYNNGDAVNNSNYPYWHLESTVMLDPVSVELVSPLTLYILDEYENNKFKRPYVPIEKDEEDNDIITSLYFVTDNEELDMFSNEMDYSDISWYDNMTLPIDTEPEEHWIDPVTLTVGFSAKEEGLYVNELRIYIKKQNLAKDYTSYHYIGTIFFKGTAIGEDDRYRTLFANFGIPHPVDYQHVFKEYDPLEEGNDYELVNRKSKELFLTYDKIFPYIGTYKALINAVKFLGYNDIYFKEWYKFMNDEDNHNTDSVNYISIDMRTGETLQSKLKRFGFTYEEYLNLKKLNRLTMMYRFNIEDDNDDTVTYQKIKYIEDSDSSTFTINDGEDHKKFIRTLDFPKVIKNFDYGQEEVLAKLYYLKIWLEKYIIGVNCRIIDITGEGVYFEHLKNNAYAVDYVVNNMQKEYSLTPYVIYDENDEGPVMRNSKAIVKASLKEYDYTKILDIQHLKIADFVKYEIDMSKDVILNPSGPELPDKVTAVLWDSSLSRRYDNLLKKQISEKSYKMIEEIQLFGAPYAAPFILDEYFYELNANLPNGSMIELNDEWTGGTNIDEDLDIWTDNNQVINSDTLFISENEIYISNQDSSIGVNWQKNAPIIKVQKCNLRDITKNRWNQSLKYGVNEVFNVKENRYLYRFFSYNDDILGGPVLSNEYILFVPVKEKDLKNSKKYKDLINNMPRNLRSNQQRREAYINNAKNESYGKLTYTEDNFYEAPMIKLHNYKLMYNKEGVVYDFKDSDGNLFPIDDFVLEMIEGTFESNELPITDNEKLLEVLHFTSQNKPLFNSWESVWGDPDDGRYENLDTGNYVQNEQWVYPEYTYKTFPQKFYEIYDALITGIQEIWAQHKIFLNSLNHPSQTEINKQISFIEEYKEKYKNIILSNIPEEDIPLYWKDEYENILNDRIKKAWDLYNTITNSKSLNEYNINYNNDYEENVIINKETPILSNRTGYWNLIAKAYDAYNNIFINDIDDQIYINGESPDLNAYTIYNSINQNNDYNLNSYVADYSLLDASAVLDSEPRFPKNYRLYGINCIGNERIRYDNVSYIYDTVKAGDYVIFNNFTNRIFGSLPNINQTSIAEASNEYDGTIKLWKHNYNLDSVNITTDTYYGIVLYNEKKMQLFYDKPILVSGKWINDANTEEFHSYKIKYLYEEENEINEIKKYINAYNENSWIKAFLINIQQYNIDPSTGIFNDPSTGNSIISFKLESVYSGYSIFSKNQVIKLVYTKTTDKLYDWSRNIENEYIASVSYRIKDVNIISRGTEYYVNIELYGRINTNLLINHYYNNYLTKSIFYKDSDYRNLIEKELIDKINITLCYANISPVSYTEKIKYNGWEESLTTAGFRIDKNNKFLNDYIDSGYSGYRIDFDPINALNVWNKEAFKDISIYKYPQDQGTIINIGDSIILEADDKNKVLSTRNNLYYYWTILNNFIKVENNTLYKFINRYVCITPEFFEKYDITGSITDIYGNILKNKTSSKFFVQ